MSLQSLADEHFDGRRLMALTVSAQLTGLWRENVDPANIYRSWQDAIPQVSETISKIQTKAATDSNRYMTATMIDAGITPEGPGLNPSGFAGFTYPVDDSPARLLEESLEFPAYRSLQGLRDGASSDRAMATGLGSLVTMGAAAVTDAGRSADGAAAATEPNMSGYVRQAEPGACARCMILAGRRYRKSEGFLRHPQCLCTHVPIIKGGEAVKVQNSYEEFTALSASEQDRRFTQSGAQAIRDGADMNQVVNARRGMSTTEGGSLVTSEGMSKVRGRYRGNAGRTMQRHSVQGQRMMPEEIYKRANGNQRIINEQLERYGYTLPGGQQSDGVLNPQLSGWYGASARERRDAVRQGR